MGEIAEAMMDGTLCGTCGEYIGDMAGYPIYCSPECEPPGFRDPPPKVKTEAQRENRRRKQRRKRARKTAALAHRDEEPSDDN